MEKTGVQKLAGILKVLVTVTFVCNLLALVLVPGLARMRAPSDLFLDLVEASERQTVWGEVLLRLAGYFLSAWEELWMFGGAYSQVLAVFLLFCGACTAVILWQARRVLDTVLRGTPFTLANAANMRRAAVCCLLISAAALLRTLWSLGFYRSPAPLLSYNALFVPIFLMAGLVFLVMSALFRQAAELKAENDLTI